MRKTTYLQPQQKSILIHCRKGERACCEEIKEFVQKYNIRQQQIATLSGECPFYFWK